MAYVETSKITDYGSVSGASTTAELPAHVSGDLIVVVYVMANSSDDHTTPAGWTKIASNGGSFGTMSAFYLSATSSSETSPASSHTTDSYRSATAFIVKDAPTTSPIDSVGGSVVHNSIVAEVCDSVPLTTVANNCLLLHMAYTDQFNHLTPEPGVMTLFEEQIRAGALGISACWDFQKTAGAINTFDWWMSQSTNDSHALVIPIKSLADVIPPRVTGSLSTVMYIGSYPAGGKSGWSANNVSTDVATIDGITTNNFTVLSNNQGDLQRPSHEGAVVTSQTNGQITLSGMDFDDDGPFNITGKKIAFHFAVQGGIGQTRTAAVEDHGFIVGLKSGLNEYALYDGGGSDTNVRAAQCIVIDDATTLMHEQNVFDKTDVNGCVFGNHRTTNTSQSTCGRIDLLNTITVVGGCAASPASWDTAYNGAVSAALGTVEKLGDGYQTKQDIQVGDGSSGVYFDTDGEILFTPPAASVAGKDVGFQASKVTVTLYGVSGDTIMLNDTISAPLNGEFIVHASSTSAATWEFNGGITGFTSGVTLQDIGASAYTGLNITGSSEVTHNGADLDGVTIISCSDAQAVTITGATQAALQTALDAVGSCTFVTNTVALRIEYTGTGNISLVGPSNLTFTDNTTDLHYNSTNASTLTFTPGSGSSPTTTAISGAAVALTIDSSTPITFSMPNLVNATFYELYNTTQAALLTTGTVSGGAGASYVSTIGTGLAIEAGDIIELRPAYSVAGAYKEPDAGHGATIQAVAAAGTVTFLTAMVDWDALNTWAHDPATLTEFTADVANIDIDLDDADGISQRTRIVAFWADLLTTADGVRNFWGAYTVESSASVRQNVDVVDVVLHNVGTLNILFNDNTVRYYRSDGSNPYDTSGNSIFMHYSGTPHSVDTGSGGFGASDRSLLSAASTSSATAATKSSELHIRNDLDATKPQTYNDDGSVITNDDFTLTKSDNGDGTFSVART